MNKTRLFLKEKLTCWLKTEVVSSSFLYKKNGEYLTEREEDISKLKGPQ